MSDQAANERETAQRDPRRILLTDLDVQPDLNRHLAIAWARLARHGGTAGADRVTVLKPFSL